MMKFSVCAATRAAVRQCAGSAEVRASNPRSVFMTVLGKDFDCPKLYRALL